jgi:hypothetical protein
MFLVEHVRCIHDSATADLGSVELLFDIHPGPACAVFPHFAVEFEPLGGAHGRRILGAVIVAEFLGSSSGISAPSRKLRVPAPKRRNRPCH